MLYEYQKKIVDFSASRRIVYNGSKCGSGKTLMTLESIKNHLPALIICPAFLAEVWKAEILRWLKDVSENEIHIVEFLKETLRLDKSKFTIVSYTKVININLYSQIKNAPFKSLILDEAHFLKNDTSKRCLAILGDGKADRIANKTSLDKIIFLSGTPLEKAIHLFGFMQTFKLLPSNLGSKIDYGRYFCGAYKDIWGNWNYPLSQNIDELQHLLKDTFIRASTKDIDRDLPEITHSLIRLNICQELVTKEMALAPSNLDKLENSVPRVAVSAIRVLMLQKKIPVTLKYIQNLFDNDVKKIVIFYHHTNFFEELMTHYQEKKNLFFINGCVPVNQRASIAQDFNDAKEGVILCSISASNVGLSLHTADTVVFGEVSWSWADNEQAFCRVWRKGATKNIQIHWLCIKNSLDDWMISTALKKKKVLEEFLNNG